MRLDHSRVLCASKMQEWVFVVPRDHRQCHHRCCAGPMARSDHAKAQCKGAHEDQDHMLAGVADTVSLHPYIIALCVRLTNDRVCIAAIVQTAVLPQALTAVDQTRRMLGPVTMQQIVMNLSTLAAIVMSLHGFLSNMAAGRFGVEIRESEYELSEVSNSKSRGIAGSKRARSSAHRRPARKIDSQLSAVGEMKNLPGFRKNGDLMGKNLAWVAEPARDWEDGERSDGSQENIIRQTTTWQISRSDPGVSREEDELHMLSKSGESSKTGTRDFLE